MSTSPAPAKTYHKTDLTIVNPIWSKPGLLSMSQLQAVFFAGLLAKIPSRGAITIHKARLLKDISVQLGDWDKAREDLLKEHAKTELINSETPDAGKRVVSWSEDDAKAKRIPEGEQVGSAIFESPETRAAFFTGMNELAKDLPIVIATEGNAVFRKAVVEITKLLTGDQCPEIAELDLVAYERLISDLEMSLEPVTQK